MLPSADQLFEDADFLFQQDLAPAHTVFLGLYSAFLFLQTRRVELMSNISILVSSDHITFSQASSGSSRCSLANFRRACTCVFFSRGTLRTQQDFNLSWCSVLLMVLFVTVVATAFRSLASSSCVVLGWALVIDIPRGEILRGAPDGGRLVVTLCFFHFLIIAPTVTSHQVACLFSCSPSQACAGLQFYPWCP